MKKKLLVFGYGLGGIALLLAVGSVIKHHSLHLVGAVYLICSLVFIATTSFSWQALKPAYHLWMKVAQAIGAVVTTVILTVVFFLIFTPMAIVLRSMKKDHLQRWWEKEANSYWQKKPPLAFSKERYHQQF